MPGNINPSCLITWKVTGLFSRMRLGFGGDRGMCSSPSRDPLPRHENCSTDVRAEWQLLGGVSDGMSPRLLGEGGGLAIACQIREDGRARIGIPTGILWARMCGSTSIPPPRTLPGLSVSVCRILFGPVLLRHQQGWRGHGLKALPQNTNSPGECKGGEGELLRTSHELMPWG